MKHTCSHLCAKLSLNLSVLDFLQKRGFDFSFVTIFGFPYIRHLFRKAWKETLLSLKRNSYTIFVSVGASMFFNNLYFFHFLVNRVDAIPPFSHKVLWITLQAVTYPVEYENPNLHRTLSPLQCETRLRAAPRSCSCVSRQCELAWKHSFHLNGKNMKGWEIVCSAREIGPANRLTRLTSLDVSCVLPL